jgi:hypothetical protein
MKLTAAMHSELAHIYSWESSGYLGCPAHLIPTCTLLALSRRKLIERNVDGSRKLTDAGMAVLGTHLGVDA